MMKGMLKKCLGVVAAAAMAVTGMVALTGTANAAQLDTTSDATITLTGGSDRLVDHSFKVVKLANYYTNVQGQLSVKTVEDNPIKTAVQTALDESKPNGWTVGDKQSDPMLWVATNLMDSRQSPYAGALRNFVSQLDGLDDGNADFTITEEDVTDGQCKYTPEDGAGIYVLFDRYNATETSPSTTSLPILVGTKITSTDPDITVPEYGDGKVEIKNYANTFDKGLTDTSAGDQTYQIGDYPVFYLEASIPNTTNSDTFQMYFTDEPGKGLTLVNDQTHPLQVFIDKDNDHKFSSGDVLLNVMEDYTVDGFVDGKIKGNDDSHDDVMTVRMTDNWLLNADKSQQHVGEKLVVRYYALVNSEANLVNGANNAAVSHIGDYEAEDSQKVDTTWFKFMKTDAFGKGLGGAQFTIQRGSTGNPFKLVDLGEKNGVQMYRPATDEDTGIEGVTIVDYMTTPDSGYIVVQGLDDDDYWVKETKAPTDYLQDYVSGFRVHAYGEYSSFAHDTSMDHHELVNFDGCVMPLDADGDETPQSCIVKVMNVQSVSQLPQTGAAGITMFVVLGLLIAGVGVTVYVKSRSVRNALRG